MQLKATVAAGGISNAIAKIPLMQKAVADLSGQCWISGKNQKMERENCIVGEKI